VEEGDLDVDAAQRARGVEAGEAPADDDHVADALAHRPSASQRAAPSMNLFMYSALLFQPSFICFSAVLSMRPPTPQILASMVISAMRLVLSVPMGSARTMPEVWSLSASVLGVIFHRQMWSLFFMLPSSVYRKPGPKSFCSAPGMSILGCAETLRMTSL